MERDVEMSVAYLWDAHAVVLCPSSHQFWLLELFSLSYSVMVGTTGLLWGFPFLSWASSLLSWAQVKNLRAEEKLHLREKRM